MKSSLSLESGDMMSGFLMKEVKYRVGDAFANMQEGTVINAILLVREGEHGLVYHPHTRGECPSFEMVAFDGECWNPCNNTYLNVDGPYGPFEKAIFGKTFKFKREVLEQPT